MQKQIVNILTIDIEDYFMVSAFEKAVRFKDWDKYESRVVQNTKKILAILQEYNTKATFFVLGWVAERFPALVKEISIQGHEIASHGYAHRLIYNQTIEEFRQDIKKAKKILEEIIDKPVLGFRAPSYSITNGSLYALDILIEEGFRVDSSIFPIYHDRGGIPNAKRFPHRIRRNGKEIIELPLSTANVLGFNIPISGGGYFRLFPYWFIKWAIEKINQQNQPVIVYIHPWEIDPHQPIIKTNMITNLRHRFNLAGTEKKFKRLLSEFKFSSIQTVLGSLEIK